MGNAVFSRKIVVLLLGLTLGFGLLPLNFSTRDAQAANYPLGEEMVANGSFESLTNGFPSNWTAINGTQASMTVDTSQTTHGGRALKITDTAGSCNGGTQSSCEVGVKSDPIAIRYGDTYTAEVRAYVSQGQVRMMVRTYDSDHNPSTQLYVADSTLDAGWQTVSITFTPPESHSATAVILVYERSTTAPTQATIDEVSLKLSGDLVHNGGFELIPTPSNGFPIGWVPLNNVAPSSVSMSYVPANVSAGSGSVMIVDNSGGEPYGDVGLKAPPISIRPGETFDIKAKVKVAEGNVMVLARSSNGSGQYEQSYGFRTAAAGWQTIAFSHTPVDPDASTLVLEIYGRDTDNSDGWKTTAYVDEVSVTRSGLLYNPSFEEGTGTWPEGWSVSGTPASGTAWVTAPHPIDHGTKAVRIAQSSVQLHSIPVKHKLLAINGSYSGATYTAEVKTKVTSGKATLTLQYLNAAGYPIENSVTAQANAAPQWQTLKATLKPPNYAETVRVVLSVEGASADAVFDSAELRFGWPITAAGDKTMPFRPADQSSAEQNPPDFSWTYVDGADRYELQIATNASFDKDSIIYEHANIPVNVYNLPRTLTAGTAYYWRVRYHATQGSAWSDVRQFSIKSNAHAFTVPDIETMIHAVPSARPRILTTPGTLQAFKAKKDNVGMPIFDFVKARIDDMIARNTDSNPNNNHPLPSDPTSDTWDATSGESTTIIAGSLMYLITGEPQYLEFTKTRLMNIIGWDPNGATSYQNDDRSFREIVLAAAVAYDWLNATGNFTAAERQELLTAIHTRTQTLYGDILDDSSLYKSPYNSHGGTAAGYVAIIATAMMHETAIVNGVSMHDAAKEWFRKAVPVRINMYPPIGGEQGGWASGTGYWGVSHLADKRVADVLKAATGVDLYKKAFSINEQNMVPYFWPIGSPAGNFGDSAEEPMKGETVSLLRRQAEMYANPIAQWYASAARVQVDPYRLFAYPYGTTTVGKLPPFALPPARWQKDVGWVAMHSSLYDPDRISLTFKSSPYGSYNHSHADQNGFTINAFGEKLAIDAGYYDDYASPYHNNYYRTTLAHNAITYKSSATGVSMGQKTDDLKATGRIAGFASIGAFDGTVGDATAAYNQDANLPGLDLARRGIIYVKPNAFVMIDKLDAKAASSASFEYLLHADSNLTINGQEATIEKNNAKMKARIQYPAILNATTTVNFETASGTPITPNFATPKPLQKHAKFTFPSATSQTIISTYQPYRDAPAPGVITTQTHLDANNQPYYQRLSFADGTMVYVRLAGSGLVKVNDNFKFDGMAAAVRGNSVMLLDGVRLEKDGVALIESSANVPATVALNASEVSISGDAARLQVTINTSATTLIDETYTAVDMNETDGMIKRGVHWSKSANAMTINTESGRHFWLSNVSAPGPKPSENVTLTVKVDGQIIGEHSLPAHGTYAGGTASYGQLTSIPAGTYTIISAPPGLIFDKEGAASGRKTLSGSPWVILDGASGGMLELQTAP
ncbi:DUF4962 domain-containing protein [Paenibacillus methanolicus]|uniref:Carbohydrate binding protein n=1 Tax=Paenibacillus methanolicus TaxID=582686 RepID=A0A5S5CHQ6_9BACL|nr:DUF4962 domain-containing protein [Paenibacillus methanolicus]TYP79329.1 carbohydrate binding protein [Paenibacillus methanolicus]